VECLQNMGGDRDGDEDGDWMGARAGVGIFCFWEIALVPVVIPLETKRGAWWVAAGAPFSLGW
jgi:hypothetical protein